MKEFYVVIWADAYEDEDDGVDCGTFEELFESYEKAEEAVMKVARDSVLDNYRARNNPLRRRDPKRIPPEHEYTQSIQKKSDKEIRVYLDYCTTVYRIEKYAVLDDGETWKLEENNA